MKSKFFILTMLLSLAGMVIIISCSSDDDPPPPPPVSTYSVGGTVSGATGSLVLVQGSEELNVSGDGSFTFSTKLNDGSSYNVTVKSAPDGQYAEVANGGGTINGANVSNISVTCIDIPAGNYTVGGTVEGLTGTLVITNNGADELTINENGPFTFGVPLADGSAYEVTIVSQPDGELCSISSGTGTIDGTNVTDVAISCQASPEISANYYAVDRDAKFYEFQADKSLLEKSGTGLNDFSSVSGLAYDSNNDILYGFSNQDGTLLSIDRTTGVGTAIAQVPTTEIVDIAYDYDADKLYGVNYSFGQLLEINVTTGDITSVYTDEGLKGVYGLAYDDFKLYGSNSSEELLEISITAAPPTMLGGTFGVSRGLAYDDANSKLYGVYAEGGNDNTMTLWQFNTTSGFPTKVGLTGLLSRYGAGLAYAAGDQLMASSGTYFAGAAKLYEVDSSDGTTVSIGSTGYYNYSDLAWRDGDQLYGLELSDGLLLTFDLANGTTTFKREPYFDATTRIAVGLTYKAADDGFYTLTQVVNDGIHLTFIDAASNAAPVVNGNQLALFEDETRALAYDNENGILYAATTTGIAIIDESLGMFVDGSEVSVALTDVILSMNFDPVEKVLVATTADKKVIAINPATGDFVELTTTSETLIGITTTR